MIKDLDSSIQYLKSIGPKRAKAFEEIGISTIKDLLFYFPSKYLDRSTIINSVKSTQYIYNGYDGEITILGSVVDKEVTRFGKRQILKVILKDNSGLFECVWFQGTKYFTNLFNEGEHYAVSAKPVISKSGALQFIHPDFDRIAEEESQEFINTGKIIPFYRIPSKLKSVNIGDFSLRKIMLNTVSDYAELLPESLPSELIEKYSLPPLIESVKNVHFPENEKKLSDAKERFKYEELFYFETLVALRKFRIKEINKGISFSVRAEPIKKILNHLSFELTESQLKVLGEIRKDMESGQPMNRLLQGDVGSGKTIVSLIAMIIAIDNGFQTALMVPTEILAYQHYKTVSDYLSGLGIRVNLLTGSMPKKEKTKILESIKIKDVDVIIGTHALIEETVEFRSLGLIVIDEQHRFGVAQRSKLIQKGYSPDILIMTATPIPRTMSMTIYGDLDISTITQMPKNRVPIKTALRDESKLPEIYSFIKQKIKTGYQVYIVYPLVEESEKINLKAAETFYEELKNSYFKELNVGLIHGKLKWKEKDEVMTKFSRKEFDILISTTVIEVGIDIPDANIIVINDAFRFGLSQLHQLRGRVGRRDQSAYCILISKKEHMQNNSQLELDFDFSYLSTTQIEKYKAKIRLNAMVKYASGFDLSEIDLKLRGPGNIFGTEQSGFPELKFADISKDADLLDLAKKDAFELIFADPDLKERRNSIVKYILKTKYSKNLKYSQIA